MKENLDFMVGIKYKFICEGKPLRKSKFSDVLVNERREKIQAETRNRYVYKGKPLFRFRH